MANVKVLDTNGNEVSELELKDEIFGIKPNGFAMHAAVKSYLANQRQGTQSTLTRTEVRGGGRKPWAQKHTGRARQGSIRAPQWKGGGIALGPKPRSYRCVLNKKIKRLAMKSALSSKVKDGELVVLDRLELGEYRTKTMVGVFNALGVQKKALLVLGGIDKFVIKSSANIKGIKTTQTNTLNVYDILNCERMIVLKDAVCVIEEVFA